MSRIPTDDPNAIRLVKAYALGKTFAALAKCEKTLEEADCTTQEIYVALDKIRQEIDKQVKNLNGTSD
jgi:hypothetical protein